MEPQIVKAVASMDLEEPEEQSSSGGQAVDAKFISEVLLPTEMKKELIEILRCAVCLELPKITTNTQVHICENGHHFCQSCHGRLSSCAVCRGNLGRGRNFVVEELIMKLGKKLGIVKPLCYRALHPPPIPKGTFSCVHAGCNAKSSALAMLTHVRDAHQDHFIDKLRSSPHSGWFEVAFHARLMSNTKYVKSYQVSDMGLISIVVQIHQIENGFVQMDGHVQMMQLPAGFIYNLAITSGCKQWTIRNKDVSGYANAQESVQHFIAQLDESDDKLYVNCLVRRTGALKPVPLNWPNVADEVISFPTDRASRRTVTRNERRKRLRRKFREKPNSSLLKALLKHME